MQNIEITLLPQELTSLPLYIYPLTVSQASLEQVNQLKRRMASHNYLLSYSNHYAPMSMMIRIPFAAVNNGSLVTRRAATNCSFTTATTPSPEPPLRRSANYQPNQWDYNSITSLDSDYDQVIITAE